MKKKLAVKAVLLLLATLILPHPTLAADAKTLTKIKTFYQRHRPLIQAGGSFIAIQAIVIAFLAGNIASRKKAQQDLKTNQTRLRQILDLMPHLIFAKNWRGEIVIANKTVERLTDTPIENLIGKKPTDLSINPQIKSPLLLDYTEATDRDKDGSLIPIEDRFTDARGIEHIFQVIRIPFEDPANDCKPALLTIATDITEQRLMADKLTYYATHDQLTDIINRREFELRLQRVLNTANEQGTENAVCYIDLDQFKVINDTAGHAAGDQLLIQLAKVMTERVRVRDTLSRLGGDEFGILLEHCTLNQARRVANDVLKAIQDFVFLWEGKSFRVGASIGVVPVTSSYDKIAEILQAADHACYLAKEAGRNRVHVHNPDDREYARRHGEMQWVARIHHALDENRFVLYAQNIACVEGIEEGHHYEMLLRLRDEEGHLVPPGAFLPAAERFGLGTKIDYWTVRSASQWLAHHPQHVKNLKLCSINLSGHSLSDIKFLEFIIGQVNEYGLNPEKLCFEITETAAIFNLQNASRFIRTLVEYGFKFSLDDFGTGLSSFAYLRSLPVHYLKIDGMFVKDIVTNPIDLAMVRSINEIGHVMNKKTIAEFVESEDILTQLKSLHIDYAQGYHIGKPQPLRELL